MSFFSNSIRAFLVMVLFVCTFSYGSQVPFRAIPLLYQVNIFQSEMDPQHYVVIGKDQVFADAGRWYVVDVRNGVITSPKLIQGSVVYFNGGFDLKLETGEWIYLPGDTVKDIPAIALEKNSVQGLIHPTLGQEPLRKIEVTRKLFYEIGLSAFVSEVEIRELGKIQEKQVLNKIPSQKNVLLYVIKLGAEEVRGPVTLRDRFLNLGKLIHLPIVHREVRHSDGHRTIYIWTFENKKVAESIHKVFDVDPLVIKDLTDSVLLPEAMNEERIARVPSLFSKMTLLENKVILENEKSDSLAVEIGNLLRTVEFDLNFLQNAEVELFGSRGFGSAKKNFFENYAAPMKKLLTRCYDVLDRMQTPMSRKVLLFQGDNQVERFQYLSRPSGFESKTYFESWLFMLKQEIQWVHSATEAELHNMEMTSEDGGRLNQFGFLKVTLKDFKLNRDVAP